MGYLIKRQVVGDTETNTDILLDTVGYYLHYVCVCVCVCVCVYVCKMHSCTPETVNLNSHIGVRLLPSAAVKVSIRTPYSTPVHTHQAGPCCADPLIGMKGRGKVPLGICITVSLLGVINHKAERPKEGKEKCQRGGGHSTEERCSNRETDTEKNAGEEERRVDRRREM